MAGYVYMLASKKDGTLYVGVTSDLGSRVWQHKQQTTPGFTARHGAIRLVWYCEFYEIGDAILFERRLKKWRRAWKIALIEELNPGWYELYKGQGW